MIFCGFYCLMRVIVLDLRICMTFFDNILHFAEVQKCKILLSTVIYFFLLYIIINYLLYSIGDIYVNNNDRSSMF